MLCLSGFELYPRWVPLIKRPQSWSVQCILIIISCSLLSVVLTGFNFSIGFLQPFFLNGKVFFAKNNRIINICYNLSNKKDHWAFITNKFSSFSVYLSFIQS